MRCILARGSSTYPIAQTCRNNNETEVNDANMVLFNMCCITDRTISVQLRHFTGTYTARTTLDPEQSHSVLPSSKHIWFNTLLLDDSRFRK
jgi:hypothetical protein